MSYIEDSLSNNEEIKEIFNLHWFAKIPMILWLLLAIPTFGITLIFAIYEYFRLKNIEQGVTSKRVILKTGIISRKTEEMKVDSIETIEINQSILGRIFGFGTVELTGRGESDLNFKNIDEPLKVKKAIENI